MERCDALLPARAPVQGAVPCPGRRGGAAAACRPGGHL
jgi:hypothetical protein